MPNLSKQQQITDTEKDLGLVIANIFGPVFNMSSFCLHCQIYYLPCFAVDKKGKEKKKELQHVQTFELDSSMVKIDYD